MIVSSETLIEQRAVCEPPVRVLHLNAGNLYGGVETLLVTLANLRQLCPSMESHFALCFEGRLSRELAASNVPWHRLGEVRISRPWTMWRARRRLRELLRRERYDAVICHLHWPLVVFGPAAKAEGRRLIYWAHNYHTGENWLERMAERVAPDLAISTSASVATSIDKVYRGTQASVLYCPLTLNEAPESAQWRSAVRAELGIDDDTTVIVQVSRFEPWKGQLLHLEALSRLESHKWVCWMVGGPQNSGTQQHFDNVKNAAKRLGLSNRVRFLGQRSDVPRLLAGADIFCQPNQGPEPFGIVFVEALWAGLPVVTTAIGGAQEIVDESCGLLAEPNSPTRLAEHLDRLIQSSEMRARLGSAGPVRARWLCDPAKQMQALEGLVRESFPEGAR